MSRTALALLVAPLWVPLIVLPLEYRAHVPRLDQSEVLRLAAVVAFQGYLGVYSFGLPAFLVLRSFRRIDLGSAAALGFAVGMVTVIAFDLIAVLVLALAFGGDLPSTMRGLGRETIERLYFLHAGLLGMLVGCTMWLIARPDRLERGGFPGMRRMVIGFAVAPLWVPLTVAAYALLFSIDATFGLAMLAVPISSLFAYLGAFALGIPAFLMLHSWGVTGLSGTAALGCAIGVVLWFLFLLVLRSHTRRQRVRRPRVPAAASHLATNWPILVIRECAAFWSARRCGCSLVPIVSPALISLWLRTAGVRSED